MTMNFGDDAFRTAFAGRDPAPAAAVLRHLALMALAEALGAIQPPAPYPARPAADPLADWFGEAQVQGRTIRKSLRLLQRRFLFGQINEDLAVSRALVAGAVPVGRIARLRDRLVWRWRRKGCALAPPGIGAFGPALAGLAFGDVAFRRSAVTMIRDHLGARVLFHPDPAPVPVLSPACYLILIAAHRRLAKPTAVAQGVAGLAGALAAEAGWAAFWDQWVLQQAAGNAAFTLPDAIRTLPLLRQGAVVFAQPATENDPRVALDWANGLPAYCQYLRLGLL
ncbi:hypothetical protein [Pseudorhodobacter sp.]|uniref:hypothetical protein n=1 Tax=Pseudorhodobacter sp. TaxID=1934400 RepID=UPI002AFDFE06|nr:hypothetical protein [Pseudorhodobacter sp.]